MPLSDARLWISDAQAMTGLGDTYSSDEINFGIAKPKVGFGNKFGLHVIVTTAFTALTEGAIVWIIHGAATAPTAKHTGMFIPVSALTAGKHFFIPCGSYPVLQYVRALFDCVSTSVTAGAFSAWFGSKAGGESEDI
jgi:hypothetical protein